MIIGSIPNKRKVSFSTKLYMKWKRIELGYRRWCDSKMHEKAAEAIERCNPFNPKNKGRNQK